MIASGQKSSCVLLHLFKIILVFVLALGFNFSSFAFVPSAKTLLLKVSSHGGQGVYRIDQDLTLVGGGDTFEVSETWTVADGNTMRVSIAGKKALKDLFQTQILYHDGKKYVLDQDQRLT